MFHSQRVWKVQCHFLSSGSGPFFAPENLSSISLFGTQLSGREWLEENRHDEVQQKILPYGLKRKD